MTRSTARRRMLLAHLLLLVGCASAAPPGPTPAQLAGEKSHTVVIVPLNVVVSLPARLEASTDIVARSLRSQIEAHGKSVDTIRFRDANHLWRSAMKEVISSKQPKNFENAARVFARHLHEEMPFDVLVIPSLFIQNARWDCRTHIAEWDDTRQKMEVVGRLRGAATCAFRDRPEAASLLLNVLDAEGEILYSKQTGLELIEHIEVGPDPDPDVHGIYYRWGDDVPPIGDETRVRAGVARGLAPFLPEGDTPVDENDGVETADPTAPDRASPQ
jgi:hypothetical protein